MSPRQSPPLDLTHRPRRLRRSAAIRALVRETRLSPEMFIYPLFVCTGDAQRREIGSMPGVFQMSVDEVVNEAQAAREDGVTGVLSHAAAGADIVAPSYMMDGRIGRIREALDHGGFVHVAIMSYAAKYCSAFYGPFREAADSAPAFGDRRSHQMDPANVLEALRQVELDIEQGADILMVKPATTYLDVIARVKAEFAAPLAAYHVSGEYAMLKAAARNGWIDEPRAMMETLTSIRRAGADIIITYYAREAARKLRG